MMENMCIGKGACRMLSWEEMYKRTEQMLGRRLKPGEERFLIWLFERYEEEAKLKEKQR